MIGESGTASVRAILAAIEQMEQGVVVTDKNGIALFANAAAARMYGTRVVGAATVNTTYAYDLSTETGEPYPGDTRPLTRAVLRGETVINERWRIRRTDGTEVLASGSARPLVDEDGNRIGAVLTVRDDTARDNAERLERERNALALEIHDAFTQAPRSTVVYDRSGKVLAVNGAFERLWGVTFADIPADYSILTDPQLGKLGVMGQIRRAFGLDGARSNEGFGEPVSLPPLRYEMSEPTGKGLTLWTQAHLYPVRDSVGNVERVVLAHEDVSEKRRAQLAHQRTIALQQFTAALSLASSTDEMSAAIVANACNVVDASGVAVLRELPDGKHLELLDARGISDGVREKWTYISLDRGLPSGDVARSRLPVFMRSRDEMIARYPSLEPHVLELGYHATAMLPLMVRDRFMGALSLIFAVPQTFDDDFRTTASTLAGLSAQGLDRARLFDAAVSSRTRI